MKIWDRLWHKQDPNEYKIKDNHLVRSLRVRDLLGLGIGMIVSASIFTLPGEVAAMHTGPAVVISFVLAGLAAGLIALIYAEMSSAMPFAGSAYSWTNVLFGEFPGWIVGWALLAEYLMCLAFVSTGLSANLRPLLVRIGIHLPNYLAHPLSMHGLIDIIAVIALVCATILVGNSITSATKVENILVTLKVFAVLLFVVVGATAIHKSRFIPFIPHYRLTNNGAFGGWQGIYAGISMIFVSYVGFDVITANAAEVKKPQRSLPLGILGSLGIATIFFVLVSLVLIGDLPYQKYLSSAEPIGLALRAVHHSNVAFIVQLIAVFGMFTALIGLTMAGSRLLYSFGRDGMLPKWLGKLDHKKRPNNALITIILVAIVCSIVFPFALLSQLISAGTLITFMFVSVGMMQLRKRENKDLPDDGFKVPLFPILPILGFIVSAIIFGGLSNYAKLCTIIWFIFGLAIYFIYGIWHTNK